ncbi:MAG: hypothetical protein V4653_14740 [Pseudomonadota bacterium]
MNEAEQRRVIATLAPAVQHDVNNMLTVTLATLELMRHGLAPGDAALRRIDRIDSATRKLDALMRGFLTLARAKPEVATVDVALLLHRMAPALRLAMAGAAALTIEAPAEGVEVACDAARLTATLVESLRGAAEATLRLDGQRVLVARGADTVLVPFQP